MAARGVVRDVTRALGKPYSLGDRISKMIPFEIGMTLEKQYLDSQSSNKPLRMMTKSKKL